MRAPVAVLTLVLILLAVPDAGAAPARLKAFPSCTALVSYARAGAQRTGGGVGVVPRAVPVSIAPIASPAAPGGVAPTAAPAAGEVADTFSGTNVQELGVDEPDLVKTDGRHVYAVTDDTLRIVDVTGAAPIVVGTLPLTGSGHRLLLRGTRVLVIADDAPPYPLPLPIAPMPLGAVAAAKTTVTEVDVSDPTAPKVARTMTIDGRFVDARQNGGTARLVIDAAPAPIARPETAGKRAFLGRTVLKSNLSGRTFTRDLAPCDAIRRPRQFSGLDVLAILTVDLDRGMYSLDRDGVMAGAEVVYGSSDSLYVASRRYVRSVELGAAVPDSLTTEIDRFDISDPDRTVYSAGGTVPGFILNSYALSEYKGDLRVASTEDPPWQATDGVRSSTITVLRQNGTALQRIGSVGGLGKGQQIYAVRFMGDRGYVVTFQRVDPLYTLDLSDPTAPAVRGALELPGYSSYLHPVSDTLLLGIGPGAGGLEASLFDVSDPAAPKRVSQLDLGQGYSAVEGDPHAFLYWPATKLAVLPLSAAGFTGAVALHAGAAPLSEAGRITAPSSAAPIERALVVGDRLYTLSYLGLGANRLDTLAPSGFTAF